MDDLGKRNKHTYVFLSEETERPGLIVVFFLVAHFYDLVSVSHIKTIIFRKSEITIRQDDNYKKKMI